MVQVYKLVAVQETRTVGGVRESGEVVSRLAPCISATSVCVCPAGVVVVGLVGERHKTQYLGIVCLFLCFRHSCLEINHYSSLGYNSV